MKRAILLLVLLTRPLMAAEPGKQGPELKDGDVVALIGGGFIEREAQYGYIETALTARYADRDIKFRNLGWSGDTVWCESRAYFGTPEDGFKHLLEHVDLVKPTVIIVNYGGNEAFAGEAGLPRFIEGYNRLLDELEKRTRRIVLLSPTPLERHREPLPELEQQNANRKRYAKAVEDIGLTRSLVFVDIFNPLKSQTERRDEGERNRREGKLDCLVFPAITIDGVNLAESGYQAAASFIAVRFASPVELSPPISTLVAQRLAQLRVSISEKNAMFFHRHRPQNETYLRGFRKHEQGNNAVEIYEFEKLVAEKEAEIASLRGELLKALQSKEGGK